MAKKEKKIFKDLIICSVIFGKNIKIVSNIFICVINDIELPICYFFFLTKAMKCQLKFRQVSPSDMEGRIKYYLAQAPFNIKNKEKQEITKDSNEAKYD